MNLKKRSLGRVVTLVFTTLLTLTSIAQGAAEIMPFSEVRIGMKGYGLTVFHGTKIEPFPVEIISIISDSTPKRGTIWMRCPSPRMQQSGPVQGMSGSPIYLWEEGEEGTIGEGGRLVGAFAFGFGLSKDCIVGVQPIELMRGIASRKGEPLTAHNNSWGQTGAILSRLAEMAQAHNTSHRYEARLEMFSKLVGESASPAVQTRGVDPKGPQPLMLPLNAGSQRVAELLTPLYEPMGLLPVSSGLLAGPPPPSVNADDAKLEPGSVLSVPLAYGDMDLSAMGTVTDVLDDGTVLGFGHPMFGQGSTALPMATGYVHFIVPSITISFKQGGSLKMVGSLVRDESTGIAGVDGTNYTTAPMDIELTFPNGDTEAYHYELVNYKPLTAMLGVNVMLQSLTARQDLPIENTLDLQGELTFSGGRRYEVNTVIAGGDATSPIIELLPAMVMLTNNPFESLKVESIDMKVSVREGIELASITGARLQRAELAPGDTVRVAVDLLPYNGEPYTEHLELKLPDDLPEGEYPLLIGGADRYMQMKMSARPHLMRVENVDELVELLQATTISDRTALYLSLPREERGLAVGRTELPSLPASRAVLLASPTHTLAQTYGELVTTKLETKLSIEGDAMLNISVREPINP